MSSFIRRRVSVEFVTRNSIALIDCYKSKNFQLNQVLVTKYIDLVDFSIYNTEAEAKKKSEFYAMINIEVDENNKSEYSLLVIAKTKNYGGYEIIKEVMFDHKREVVEVNVPIR